MRCNNHISSRLKRSVLGGLLAITAGVLSGSQAQADVTDAWVFNGGDSLESSLYGQDAFNSEAFGNILREMGLLDEQGRPPVLNLWNDMYLRHGDTIVGRAIYCFGENGILYPCAYESLDGTQRAYDISNYATMKQVWEEISPNGTITIMKHGTPGLILLDDGKIYAGFRNEDDASNQGTRMPTSEGAYPLPEKPGAAVTVRFVTCHSSNDWDGIESGCSVAESARRIFGVASATGKPGNTYTHCRITLPGATPAQVKRFVRVLEREAKKRGFLDRHGRPSVGALLSKTNPTARAAQLDNAQQQSGVAYKLHWGLSDAIGSSGETPIRDMDPSCDADGSTTLPPIGPAGGVRSFDLDGPEGDLALRSELWVPEWSLTEETFLDMLPVSRDDLQIPVGLEPVATPIQVRKYGVDGSLDLQWPAELTIEFPLIGSVPIGLFQVEVDGSLTEVVDAWIDPVVCMAGTSIQRDGTFVLLGDTITDRPADFNFDRRVNVTDLLEFIEYWGACQSEWCQHDLNGDGRVNIYDLLAILDQWGSDF